ncbi:SHOCT domain-containing protein [uncultured Sphaerochaeta sp.]|uniref:SHOCT domain-containing protein n=1 Tax=uncultured Sphaerochaeta sp. TaxID=886478 RepID=UPI002A0A3942|nr:SHOCT domain-containing protein [uncultured Sphaerochaeta sp.]
MTDESFSSESAYQASLALAENLLRSELLTQDEFAKTKALLLEKYKPAFGRLFAEFR